MLLYKWFHLSGSSIDFQSNTPEGDRPSFDLYTSKLVPSVTRGDEIKGGEIDAHFCPEWPDRHGWHMSSSGQDLLEVGESPPFVPVKEEGGGDLSKNLLYTCISKIYVE